MNLKWWQLFNTVTSKYRHFRYTRKKYKSEKRSQDSPGLGMQAAETLCSARRVEMLCAVELLSGKPLQWYSSPPPNWRPWPVRDWMAPLPEKSSCLWGAPCPEQPVAFSSVLSFQLSLSTPFAASLRFYAWKDLMKGWTWRNSQCQAEGQEQAPVRSKMRRHFWRRFIPARPHPLCFGFSGARESWSQRCFENERAFWNWLKTFVYFQIRKLRTKSNFWLGL